MRWRGRRRSDNVVDRRGSGKFIPRGRRGVGGGAMILLLLAGLFFGKDVSNMLGLLLGAGSQQAVQQIPQQQSTAQTA